MLSCVIHAAHDLRVEERKTPEPKTGEVLVRLGAGEFADRIYIIIMTAALPIFVCASQ